VVKAWSSACGNELAGDHVGFGVPDTSTHLHGGHHPARSDGFRTTLRELDLRPVIRRGGVRLHLPCEIQDSAVGRRVTERGSTCGTTTTFSTLRVPMSSKAWPAFTSFR